MKQLIAFILILPVSVVQGKATTAHNPSPGNFMQVPFKEADRIGWSSDGNHHDSDDWGATAVALAMFAKAGVQDRLVHLMLPMRPWVTGF